MTPMTYQWVTGHCKRLLVNPRESSFPVVSAANLIDNRQDIKLRLFTWVKALRRRSIESIFYHFTQPVPSDWFTRLAVVTNLHHCCGNRTTCYCCVNSPKNLSGGWVSGPPTLDQFTEISLQGDRELKVAFCCVKILPTLTRARRSWRQQREQQHWSRLLVLSQRISQWLWAGIEQNEINSK